MTASQHQRMLRPRTVTTMASFAAVMLMDPRRLLRSPGGCLLPLPPCRSALLRRLFAGAGGTLLLGQVAGAASGPDDQAEAYRELAVALDSTVKGIKGLPTAIGEQGSRGLEQLGRFKDTRGSAGIQAALAEAVGRFKAFRSEFSGKDAVEFAALIDSPEAIENRSILRFATAYFLPFQRTSEVDFRPQTPDEVKLNGFGQNLNNFVQLAHGRKLERAKVAYEQTILSLDAYLQSLT